MKEHCTLGSNLNCHGEDVFMGFFLLLLSNFAGNPYLVLFFFIYKTWFFFSSACQDVCMLVTNLLSLKLDVSWLPSIQTTVLSLHTNVFPVTAK
jgi:hypothetical protein